MGQISFVEDETILHSFSKRNNSLLLRKKSLKAARSEGLKSVVLRALSTVALASLGVLLARYKLGPEEWRSTLVAMPIWALLVFLLLLGFCAIAVQFLHAFMLELGRLARRGGKNSARWFAKLPLALRSASSAVLDQIVSVATRRSFDGAYRARVFEDYGLFNDRGLGLINAARLDLDKVYVELRVATHIGPITLDLLGNDSGDRQEDDVSERQSIWDFLRVVRRGTALALIGAPGSGKTTLLQYLVLIFVRNRQRQHGLSRRLPILVELRSLAQLLSRSPQPDLAAAIRACWKNSSLSDLLKHEPEGWLERRLRKSQVLLLLDGLDEVPKALRGPLSRWLSLQIQEYRECLFVVTSRPGGYAEAPLAEAFVLEVQPFSVEQTDAFIESWYLANEIVASGSKDNELVRRRASQEANALRAKLKDSPDLDALTVNPLLLTMVCMVHRYHGALPGSRSQLYGEICQVLLERWRQAKGITDELKGEQTLAVLRPLAEEFMSRETRELPETEVLRIIEGPLASIGYDEGECATAPFRFLRAVQADSGLLLEKEAGRWSFAHKTFQEYLAAEHWLRTPSALPSWRDKVASDWWREALLLFAARTEATDLVEAALAHESASSWALAYQCLSEAQRLAPGTRAKTEALIRRGLVSDDFSIFTSAARAYHHLQQRRVKRISELYEQRVELVSQAEYRLFLQQQPKSRLELLPPHWISEKFDGAPEDPILGILPWQAESFAQWAEGGAYTGKWELPDRDLKIELPESSFVFWCSDGVLDTGSAAPAEEQGLSEASGGILPSGLQLALAPRMARLHDVESALGRAIKADFGVTRNLTLLLARSLEYALLTGFGREPQLSQAQASAFAFGAGAEASVEAIMHGGHNVFATSLNSFFKHNWGDRPKEWRAALQSRIDLILSATGPIANRDAWRGYASELLALADAHLSRSHPMRAMYAAIKLLESRKEGRSQPRECLVLVRSKRIRGRHYEL